MAFTATAALGALSALQISQAKKANALQKQTMEQADRQARQTAAQADQAFNKANQKAPNVMGILAANETAGKAGLSSTMLTGPTGIDPSALLLGRATLLGG